MALLGTALTVGAPRVADPRHATTETVVRAFCAAIPETIRTSDVAAVEAVAAENLVTHCPAASVARGYGGLTRYLAALHRTAPDVEIAVDRVVAAGDMAVADLAVGGGEGRTFLGLPVNGGSPLWGTVDAVRVAGRPVIEHWSRRAHD